MENYYSYYVFDVNLATALVISLIIITALVMILPWFVILAAIVLVVILVADARSLRHEIRRLALGSLSASGVEKAGG